MRCQRPRERRGRWTRILLLASVAAVGLAAGGQASLHAQGEPTVQVRDVGAGGLILTASTGMTLYTFDPDPPSMSVCNVGCIETWPPLVLSAGDPVAPPGLAGALTTFMRADGRRQVAYEGRPLCFYDGDRQPGDTNGDGLGGVWHVARPAAMVTPPPPPPPPMPPAPPPPPPPPPPYERP
jgi:predicted lipoprotein with Yx(FWY)xxD motif